MLIGTAWRSIRDKFAVASFATPELDARLLAQHVLNVDDMGLILREHEPVDQVLVDLLSSYADRRLGGEPVARILGSKDFYGLSFGLNADTLVPRPDTELLVDLALAHLDVDLGLQALDLGTGSGCIAISMLASRPLLNVVGVDVSEHALVQARLNAQLNKVDERLTLLQSFWFSEVPPDAQFDLIVSNPPYINTDVIDELEKDVRLFDPMLALDGGVDGLRDYRHIFESAKQYLKPDGAMMVEIGFDQGAAVQNLYEQNSFIDIAVHKDIAGQDRVVTAKMAHNHQ